MFYLHYHLQVDDFSWPFMPILYWPLTMEEPQPLDEYLEKVFERAGSDPNSWMIQGISLMAAADILTSKQDNRPWMTENDEISLFLTGLALENLLKGIVAIRNPTVVAKGKLKRWKKAAHDLRKLADQAGIDLSDSSSHLMDNLSRYVKWAGRYPIPTRSSDLKHQVTPDGSPVDLYYVSPQERQLIWKLFEQFADVLMPPKRAEGQG